MEGPAAGDEFTIGQAVTGPNGRNGLRDLGKREWQVQDTDGQTATVPPDRDVTLKPGIALDFGSGTGGVLE